MVDLQERLTAPPLLMRMNPVTDAPPQDT
uniref:Uncharacterized protein n=1 Tax=Anguilla anguilla TaxID=7936 RepID=A0A0E9UET7_ANGAN